MADGRRETNDGNARGRSGSGRPASRSSESRPARGRPTPERASGRSSGRPDRPGRPDRAGDGRRSSSSDRPARKGDWSRPAAEQGDRSEQQERYDGPPLPEEITGRELDRSISGQLKGPLDDNGDPITDTIVDKETWHLNDALRYLVSFFRRTNTGVGVWVFG